MMITVSGTYEDGQVQLDAPMDLTGKRPVLVTFLDEDDELRRRRGASEFLEKWVGCLKHADVSDWRRERTDFIEGKSFVAPELPSL